MADQSSLFVRPAFPLYIEATKFFSMALSLSESQRQTRLHCVCSCGGLLLIFLP